MKIIVIGINHAGTTLVRTLNHLNNQYQKNAQIIAYDRNDNISFLGCGIALWVSNEINNPQGLFYANETLLKKENIAVNLKHELLKVDNKKKRVLIKNLETNAEFWDDYDKLVLGLGTWPIIPNIKGIKNTDGSISSGIQIVKLYQHAQEIKAVANAAKIQNVIIVGAGYIGVELVDAFVKTGKKVTLIDVESRIMPKYYDAEFTTGVEASMLAAGVKICLGEKVQEFVKENDIVTKVITDKKTYSSDVVIWAVGFLPQTKLLQGIVELTTSGAIKANSYFQTSDPDIYAIGDCVEVYNNASRTSGNLALATTAIRTGLVTAFNIINENKLPSLGFQGANAIAIFNWNMASVGLNELSAKLNNFDVESVFFEDNDRLEFLKPIVKVKIKILWEKSSRKIVGAQVASLANNHTEVIYLFSLAIMKEVTIDELPFIDLFFLPHFNKPYNFVTLAGLKALGMDYFAAAIKEYQK